jgi:nicotinate-nucleotide adenylyltransferase
MLKVGLYFGSYNPIHIGHLAIAGYLLEFTILEEIWFVVSPHNPLKSKESLLDNYQRLHMVYLAIKDNDRIRATDIEFKLPVPSYTIDTVTYLEERYPKHRFSLVMGEDNLYTLHKWKNALELVRKCPIFVYPRPAVVRHSIPILDEILSAADITYVKAPIIDISGTFIRKSIRKGRNMSYFLPAPVWKYIEEMHFYKK